MAHDEAMHRYEEQYDALKAKLQAVGFIGQGSVQTRRIACGSPTCRCHHDPDARHGPYHYWTRKARGKTVGLKLTEDELGLYREWIENTTVNWNGSWRKCAASLRVCLPSSQAGRLHEPPRLRLPGHSGGHCHPANAASRPLTLARPAASGKNSAEHAFRKRLLSHLCASTRILAVWPEFVCF